MGRNYDARQKDVLGFKSGQDDMLFCVQASALCAQEPEANNHIISGKLNLTDALTLSGSTLTVAGSVFSVATSVLVVDSGEVEIGTATPGGTLDVNGNALFGSGTNKSTFTVGVSGNPDG